MPLFALARTVEHRSLQEAMAVAGRLSLSNDLACTLDEAVWQFWDRREEEIASSVHSCSHLFFLSPSLLPLFFSVSEKEEMLVLDSFSFS